jgi:hypothetical protein
MRGRPLLKIALSFMAGLAMIFLAGFWLAFFSPRPPLTTDAATLAGDGSLIDYCRLPALDGTGKRASEIPKGNTPGCAYTHFPLPILAQCTQPLIEGADDLRGLWMGVTGRHIGHVERVEQCGDRTVITSSGIIHDYGANSTGGLTTNDTEGMVMFSLGAKEYCPRTSAAMIWQDKKLNFHLFGWGPVVVRRYREGAQLVWEYADGSKTHMDRICDLPESEKIPLPRGPRFKIF